VSAGSHALKLNGLRAFFSMDKTVQCRQKVTDASAVSAKNLHTFGSPHFERAPKRAHYYDSAGSDESAGLPSLVARCERMTPYWRARLSSASARVRDSEIIQLEFNGTSPAILVI
jgi:hypothetical protein